MARDFKDLEVWQMSMSLADRVHLTTKTFPKEELFGLVSQMRRCANSVPSNMAEGWGRQSDGSFVHSMRIARGSLNELQTQLILSCNFAYISAEQLEEMEAQTELIGRKLYNFCEKLGGKYVREETTTYGEDNPSNPSHPSQKSP